VDRIRLSRKIIARRASLAEVVTDEFLGRHPDWLTRYGELARRRGVEDAGFHLDFLAAAIEVGSERAFEEYARWAARVLHARGIAPDFLVENLEDVASALAAHIEPEEHAVVAAFVGAARRACRVDGAGSEPAVVDADLARIRDLYLQAALHGHRQAAAGLVLETLRTHSAVDIYCEVLQESLYQVGRRWEANEITVADEHLATAITQYVMVQLHERTAVPGPRRGKAIISGIEGELHQVGGQMVADVLAASGWDTWFLGTNLPAGSIVRMVEKHSPSVLGVTMTMLSNVPRLRDLIGSVRRAFGTAAPRIVVGGRAFRSAPHLWREVGADDWAADLRATLGLLEPSGR
jgi:methanogenic corrinoid protein MtbC1